MRRPKPRVNSFRAGGRTAVASFDAPIAGRRQLNMMSANQKLIERITTVCGESVAVYSFDGWRWFSDRYEAEACQRRREKFFAERAESLKRSATFKHATRRIAQD
jgi:hypothetical protein